MAIKDTIEQEYVILHTAVEHWFRGQVVTLTHLKAGLDRDIDLGRLVRLGAIAPKDSDEAREALAAIEPDAQTPAGDKVADKVPVPPLDTTNTTTAPATNTAAKTDAQS